MPGGYNPSLTTDWADGVYTFRLRTGGILKLQDAAAPDGPWTAYRQLIDGSCSWKLIREVIRFGLMDGGKSAEDAEKLLRVWVDDDFPDKSRTLALRIMDAWIAGGETVSEKKDEAAAGQVATGSTPRPSTAPAPSSTGRRRKSTPKTSGR